MHPFATIAIRAAELAGKVIARGYDRRDLLKVGVKSKNNFVTEIDLAAEQRIVDVISESYPDHGFLTEEGVVQNSTDKEYCWIIDPLDGTTNFIHGLPNFVVSIACQKNGITEVAVIYHPLTHDIYIASRGQGATLNGQRIRVSKRAKLGGALVSMSMPRPKKYADTYISCLKALHGEVSGVRASGATALDLASIASGHLDIFWHEDSKPWDLAAGALLIREAGGIITDNKGNDQYMKNGSVVAANPKLISQMLGLLKQHAPA